MGEAPRGRKLFHNRSHDNMHDAKAHEYDMMDMEHENMNHE